MKKFKQKSYTIQEGHFTGTKDLEKIPSTLEVLGKSVLGGSAVGGVLGGVLKESGIKDTGIFDGITKGGKTGFLAGIIIKLLLNNLHKPMTSVKYQEVDKMIRKEFGIYRVSGFTVGDNITNRKTVDDKFSFNSRNITDHKISFVICKNQVTMYTLGLKEDELDRLSASLDYYCKKYYGMDYSSRAINVRTCSYAVNIVFTNYQVISDFILEISELFGYKINILDNDVLIGTAALKESSEDTEKEFSNIPLLSKYDLTEIFTKSGLKLIPNIFKNGIKKSLSFFVLEVICDSILKFRDTELTSIFGTGLRKNIDNKFLKSILDQSGYYVGVHYDIDDKNDCNFTISKGVLLMCTTKDSKNDLLLEKILKDNSKINKKEISGKVNLRSYIIENKNSLKLLIDKIINSGIKFNIYNG